jgi:hypothetical protein
MKIHERAWIILESHIWTGKIKKFESLIFFHGNSWKRTNNTWISHLNWEMNDLWKIDIFHENSWKRINNTWISHLNWEKNEPWKIDIFHENSWNSMKNTWILHLNWEKSYFLKFDIFIKIHERAWIILESHILTGKITNFQRLIIFHENSWKRMNNTWISHLNWEKSEL